MKFFDLHNDLLTSVKNYDIEIKNYPKNTRVIMAVYRDNFSFLTAVEKAKKVNNRKHYLAFEDIGYSDLDLNELLSLKPKYVSLTHNKENVLGYGVDYNYPLKDKGVSLVKKLNEKGVTIDIAHLSKKGVENVLDNAEKVICSHTAFLDVYKHKRNISSETIKEIIKRNGIIGLTLVGYFLCEKTATIDSVIKHIEYYLQKFGDDNLCIGTDFNGTDYLPINLSTYKDLKNLKNKLLKLGYGLKTIDKIFNKNATKYFNV